jgi:hypothetical protein
MHSIRRLASGEENELLNNEVRARQKRQLVVLQPTVLSPFA